MDLERQFLGAVADAVTALRSRNVPTTTWNSDDGRQVQGWTYSTDSYSSEKRLSANEFRENWGNSTVILATDGSFWQHNFDGEESTARPTPVMTNALRTVPVNSFVGRKGKPFEEASAKIARLPYL